MKASESTDPILVDTEELHWSGTPVLERTLFLMAFPNTIPSPIALSWRNAAAPELQTQGVAKTPILLPPPMAYIMRPQPNALALAEPSQTMELTACVAPKRFSSRPTTLN